MIEVVFTKEQKYHGVWNAAYHPFLIEDADETYMVSIGASVLRKGVNKDIDIKVKEEKKENKKVSKKNGINTDNRTKSDVVCEDVNIDKGEEQTD